MREIKFELGEITDDVIIYVDKYIKLLMSNVKYSFLEKFNVTSFRIAVTRNYKVNDEYLSDFFTVVAWRNTAEFAAKHFKKGDSLTVQGRAEVRKYTDKDGNNRETVEIIADSVYFGEKKRDTSEQNTAPVPDDFEPIEDEFPDFPG